MSSLNILNEKGSNKQKSIKELYEKTRHIGNLVNSRSIGFCPIKESEGYGESHRLGYEGSSNDGQCAPVATPRQYIYNWSSIQ